MLWAVITQKKGENNPAISNVNSNKIRLTQSTKESCKWMFCCCNYSKILRSFYYNEIVVLISLKDPESWHSELNAKSDIFKDIQEILIICFTSTYFKNLLHLAILCTLIMNTAIKYSFHNTKKSLNTYLKESFGSRRPRLEHNGQNGKKDDLNCGSSGIPIGSTDTILN